MDLTTTTNTITAALPAAVWTTMSVSDSEEQRKYQAAWIAQGLCVSWISRDLAIPPITW
jgi:hypothetical protein